MALVLKDRVKETTTTTGTGTLTLLGADTGYQAFSAIGNGNTCYYAISSAGEAEWEVGIGTYTASGTTLSRNTILSSSAAGAAVNFPAGVKDVYVVYPSEKAVFEQATGETILNNGPITVIGTNVTSYTSFGASLGEFYANTPSFAQLYVQNLNSASNASTDIVAYNNLGDGTNKFIDMGICSSNYTEAAFPIFSPNSGYLYNDGGVLLVGSATNNVTIFAGGVNVNSAVATFGTNLSTTLTGSLSVAGATTINGVTTLNTFAYTSANIAAAANNTVLVTKAYVDNATSNGFHVHTPVLVATTGNLTATYNQPGGAGVGVGATLTNSGTQVALSIDGVSMNVADRVLVWQQTTGTQNGVYTVTTVGSGSTNWVLTRATDADEAGEGSPDSLGGGDYFFVQSGATQGFFAFVCVNTDPITFGTTAIEFNEFSQVPVYTGGTNINVSGQTISLTGTVGPTNGGTGVNTVTTGDLLYGSATNTWSKLPLGTANKSLIVNAGGTQLEWNAVSLGASGAVSGTLGETNGGTNNSSYTLGDTLYSSAANTLAKLAGNTTATKKFLSQTGTGAVSQAPSWEQPAAADITGLAASATTDTTNASNITTGTLANARTTATASNGASTIVARDVNGSFSANSGGFVSVSGNGSAITSLNASAIASGTVPTAYLASGTANNTTFLRGDSTWATVSGANDGTLTMNVSGVGLTGSASFTANQSSGSTFTVASNATNANGASTIVARDASGNFSANTITATLNGNASTATSATSATTATSATSATTATTATTANALNTGNNYQVNSLGIGTAASGTAGEIRATNNITAYYSDDRLKTRLGLIDNALAKVKSLEGFYYEANETAQAFGYEVKKEVGVSAQQVQAIMPEVVAPAPIDAQYLTVRYERLVPLLIEAIKELEAQVAELKAK